MKKFVSLVPIFLIVAGCSSSIRTLKSASFTPGSVKRVAVLPFNGPRKEFGQSIADTLVPNLMAMEFTVMERNQIEKIMQEQKLQVSGAIDSATAQEIGKVAGVDAVMMGEFTVKKSPDSLPMGPPPPAPQPTGWQKLGQRYTADGPPALMPSGMRPPPPSGMQMPPAMQPPREMRPRDGPMSAADDRTLITTLSLRLVSVKTGEILLSSSRHKPFKASQLNSILDNMLNSMKKALER